MQPITIVKMTGRREEFDPERLKTSLRKAKASEGAVEKITEHIVKEIKDGMSTAEIYRHAFELLAKEEKPAAARYSMRKAVMELGPTGFAFEKFVAQIFEAKGFETVTDVEMLGECVPHEVDVVAWNENKLIIVEAKFHNSGVVKSDLKVVLYIKARFDDLAETVFDYGGKKRQVDESWLVTNTKFSTQAIKYAECKNMKLVGWNYPAEGNLLDLIVDAGLHPITCLTSITPHDEKLLMEAGIVLCKQAKENLDIVAQAGLSQEKIDKMLEEIDLIQK